MSQRLSYRNLRGKRFFVESCLEHPVLQVVHNLSVVLFSFDEHGRGPRATLPVGKLDDFALTLRFASTFSYD